MKDMMGMICWCKYVQTIADRYCKKTIDSFYRRFFM